MEENPDDPLPDPFTYEEFCIIFGIAILAIIVNAIRDHPFKTSACLRGGGVKNLPNLPTDSTKKLPTVGG